MNKPHRVKHIKIHEERCTVQDIHDQALTLIGNGQFINSLCEILWREILGEKVDIHGWTVTEPIR